MANPRARESAIMQGMPIKSINISYVWRVNSGRPTHNFQLI